MMLLFSFWSLTAFLLNDFHSGPFHFSQKKDELFFWWSVCLLQMLPKFILVHMQLSDCRLHFLFNMAVSEVWKQKCVEYWFEFAESYLIWDCSPTWLKIKKIVHMVMMDPFADLFITICIVINTAFMAMEYHPMNTAYVNMLITANVVRTFKAAF